MDFSMSSGIRPSLKEGLCMSAMSVCISICLCVCTKSLRLGTSASTSLALGMGNQSNDGWWMINYDSRQLTVDNFSTNSQVKKYHDSVLRKNRLTLIAHCSFYSCRLLSKARGQAFKSVFTGWPCKASDTKLSVWKFGIRSCPKSIYTCFIL